jgi:hypothetical protein
MSLVAQPPPEGPEARFAAVGWLSVREPYTRGTVAADVFERLVTLLVNPWQPAVATGFHRCELCRFTGGPVTIHYGDQSFSMGSANLFVPGLAEIFVAPSTIAHYIDAHEYAPPSAFCDAVIACPQMRSMEYLKALRARGWRRNG